MGLSILSGAADRLGGWGAYGQPNVAWDNFVRFVVPIRVIMQKQGGERGYFGNIEGKEGPGVITAFGQHPQGPVQPALLEDKEGTKTA